MNEDGELRASGRRLLLGAGWNFLGRGLPLLLALALTPVLVGQLGIERWGLFTLALALIGAFGMLDLGVGPALTRALAERIGEGRREGEAELVVSAIAALLAVSLAGAGILWVLMPALVTRVLNVPTALQAEALAAMRVLVASAPLVVVNAALWGVLAAHQRFRAANLVTMPVSILYYLGPVLALSVWNSLVAAMLALVACRLANTLSYAWLVRPLLQTVVWRGIRARAVLPLLRIGGWLTFASALAQTLNQIDRFLVGALLTLSAVAFYATPLDLVLRAWIVPVAVAQALLPALAGSFRARPEAAVALLRQGVLLIGAIVLPAALLAAMFAHPALQLWLGPAFAEGGGTVLKILAVGMLFNCAAFAPGSLIEAIGRPDLLARFTLLQALLFLPLSALLILQFGIEGAALGWTLRVATDCLGRLWLVGRAFPVARAAAGALALPLAGAGVGVALAAMLPHSAAAAAASVATLGLFGGLAWRALPLAERAQLAAAIRSPRATFRDGRA